MSRRDGGEADPQPDHARHIHALYKVSKLLTRYESVERTLPKIIDVVAESLPLRTVVCLRGRDSDPLTWAWSAKDVSAQELRAAEQKATEAYAYLTGYSPKSLHELKAQPLAAEKASETEIGRRIGDPQLMTLPLVIERHPAFGVLQVGALVVEPAAALDRIDVAFVNAVANQLAIALDLRAAWERLLEHEYAEKVRARAEQAEAEARRTWAEQAERREHLLSEVSAILAASLDYRVNLESLARRLVPALADCCVIALASTREPLVRPPATFVVHVDAAKEELGREAARDLHEDEASPHGLPYVLRAGVSEIYPDKADGQASRPLGSDYPRLFRELGVESYLCVPLKVRGSVLGAIALLSEKEGRRYDAAELQLAGDIAGRAAAAIDSARLYEQAQKASRVRDDLLAIVSHDLKNPLGVILMNVGALRRGSEPEKSGPWGKQLDRIHRAADRMARLIQDLLDSASIEAGSFSIELRPVPVHSLLSEALDALQQLAADKSIELAKELPSDLPAVLADAARLQQVFANLVGNAIKFTPQRGHVTVRAENLGTEVRFSVSDTGPGIPAEDLPHLFERFWQAKRTARQGTGLGLFIVRGMVEAHRGRVWVESGLGRGTTIFFTVPAAPSSDQPGAADAVHPS